MSLLRGRNLGGKGSPRFSPHTFIDDAVFDDGTGGRGMEFGSQVHDFAEAYVLGEDIEPDEDEANVKVLLDSMEGQTIAEEQAFPSSRCRRRACDDLWDHRSPPYHSLTASKLSTTRLT